MRVQVRGFKVAFGAQNHTVIQAPNCTTTIHLLVLQNIVICVSRPHGTPAPQDRGPPLPVCSPPSLLVPFYLRACLLASLLPLSALLGGFWMGTAGWFGVSCHGGGGSQVDQETRIVAWVAPHGSSTLWPWPPRASSQPLSAPTIRGWCFAAHSQIFSASRRHSRPAMTRNPNQPYSPSTPLLGCLGGCSTFTHTWPGHVLVCALFVIRYLCQDLEEQKRTKFSQSVSQSVLHTSMHR